MSRCISTASIRTAGLFVKPGGMNEVEISVGIDVIIETGRVIEERWSITCG